MTSPPSVVFLDRDGTLIQDAHYISHPEQVHLLAGAAESIARLNQANVPVVLITNQSGIARGYFTVADYERVHARFVALLAEHNAHLDASYYCPHHPDYTGPCNCRKPSPLLFLRAAEEYQLDLSRAVGIGDRWRDLEPVICLGGTGILIPSSETPPAELAQATSNAQVVPAIEIAVAQLLDGVEVPRA